MARGVASDIWQGSPWLGECAGSERLSVRLLPRGCPSPGGGAHRGLNCNRERRTGGRSALRRSREGRCGGDGYGVRVTNEPRTRRRRAVTMAAVGQEISAGLLPQDGAASRDGAYERWGAFVSTVPRSRCGSRGQTNRTSEEPGDW